MGRFDYQATVRALIQAGYYTTFTSIFQYVPLYKASRAAGMPEGRLSKIFSSDLSDITPTEIQGIAGHFGITSAQIRNLIRREQFLKQKADSIFILMKKPRSNPRLLNNK